MRPTSSVLSLQAVLVTVVVVTAGALLWLLAPAVYAPVADVLPLRPGSASREVTQLRKRVAQLETRQSQLRQVNRQLRVMSPEIQTATSSLPEAFVRASVTARPPASPYDSVRINVGSRQGLKKGAVVWWPPGVYLGSVVEVGSRSALVRLASAPQAKTVGRINGRLTVDVTGRGGGEMVATIPETAQVATNTLVIADKFNVPVGRIADTRPAASVGRTRLFIQPVIPASMLEYVYVAL